MLLAFDDTDSPTGGCTTHLLFAVLQALPGLAPAGLPRLVRLNPNVPWKTRGNGAVCVPLARQEGPSVRIGEWRGLEIHARPHGTPAAPDDVDFAAVWRVIQEHAQPDAQPAVAFFDSPPTPIMYWAAVRGILEPTEVKPYLPALNASRGDGRGLIGCVAAAAWDGPATSHEFIAYREPAAIGTPRKVDPAPLVPLDATGATFHTWDPDAERLACVPNTPCPVLIGLRGRNPDLLLAAATRATLAAAQEPVDAWLLWDSNQASGDHVDPVAAVADALPSSTICVEGVAGSDPDSLPGGRVTLQLVDAEGHPFDAVAFEPTGSFRNDVRSVRTGDRVRATGAWKDGAVQLEKLELLEAAPVKVANPIHCDRPMKSRGKDAGYKCECGETAPESAAEWEVRPTGKFEVPVMARRHLHRPLDW